MNDQLAEVHIILIKQNLILTQKEAHALLCIDIFWIWMDNKAMALVFFKYPTEVGLASTCIKYTSNYLMFELLVVKIWNTNNVNTIQHAETCCSQ